MSSSSPRHADQPALTVTRSVAPPRSANGSLRTVSCASRARSAALAERSQTNRNSSPPQRATVASGPATRSQAGGGLLQHGIAGLVAVLVVDALEVIDVQDRDRDAGRAARDRRRQRLLGAPAVGQAGQRVRRQQALQLVLEALRAHRRLHAGDELDAVERLAQVVVGAAPQALGGLVGARVAGEEHDRRVGDRGIGLAWPRARRSRRAGAS